MRRERLLTETEHQVADTMSADALAHGDHPPSAFETINRARHAIVQDIIVQQAHREHDIAKVQSGSEDLDFDLSRLRHDPILVDPMEILEDPASREVKRDSGLIGSSTR